MFRIGLSLPLFFLFLAWILLSCPVSAQERTMVFEKYGIEEGIPESRIVSILQDDQGFIWFATQNGLVKYDGYDFHIYRPYPKEVDSTQLNLSNLSGGIIKGKDGRIWIGGVSNAGGVAYFDPQKERFYNFHYEAENPHSLIPYSKSLLLTEDRWGGIWFNNFSPQSKKKILCRLDPESRQLQQFPYDLPKRHNEILLNKNGTFAKARADGSIWLIDDHQHLRRWMPGQDSFSIVHRAGRPLPGSSHKDSIRAVLASQEDEMFLVAAHRFHVWDPVAQKVVHTYSHDPQDPNSLAPGKLDYVFEDHEGSYWAVGVEGSLSRVNPQQQQVSRYAYGKGKLAFPKGPQQIGRLVIYASGPDGLWFRTYAKAKPHFLQYDFHTQSFFYYDHNFNFKAKQLLSAQGQKKAFSLFKDQSSLLWLGYHGGLYRQAPKKKLISYYTHLEEDPHSLPAESITSLFEDSKQRLWVGTEKGLARYLPHEDQFESLPFFPGAMEGYGVNRIIEDAAGRIWVATEGGLFLFDEPSQTCKQVVFPAFEGKGPIDIMEDPKRRLWVVVWQQGVHVLDQQRAKVLRSFYPREGDSTALPSHRLQSIYQDTKGRIWFGNRFENFPGLVRWDEAQQRFFHYIRRPEKKLDIFNPEIKYLFEDPQGTLWVGTDGSLCSYDETADRFETFQDPINIKSTSSHIKDADGIVWLGTYAGGGLIRFDTRNRTQRVFGESKGLLHNNSSSFNHHTSLAIDHFGKVYYPTMRGLSVFDPSTEEFTHYFKEDGFQPYGLKYISLVTHNGDVWIGSPNGLNRIQPAQLMAKDTTPPFVHITAVQIMDTTYSLPDGKYFPLAVPFSKQVSLKHDQNDVSFEFVALHYLRSTANQYAWKLENYDKDWSKPSLERKASYTNLDPGTYTFRVKASNADGTWNEEGASMTLIIAPPWWATWWARGGLIALLLGLGYLVYRFQLRRRLEQAEAHRLKELDAVKSRLYTNITHEFRTPLTVIRGMAQKIRSQPAEAEKMILRNSNNLLRLVNQMLDLSKLESGKLEVRLLHGNVIAYLRYLTESFQSYAASKNINLVFYTESEEVMMDYDEEKLQQIVSNLLSNAIKFSGESSKIVLHSSLALQAGGEHLIIKVKDQGVGIPPSNCRISLIAFTRWMAAAPARGKGPASA
jgi:ligand-binding sensor domain-containing protein/signal transduction histidine kinase